jgi:uncharacterized protein (TIGR03083 family)
MQRHLEALRREGDTLLHVASTNLSADVPTCPGWTVADLVAHVGRLYRYVAHQVRSTVQEPMDETDYPAAEVLAATADAHAELLVVLAEVDPDSPAWNWDRGYPNVAAFWPRRMALETAVHRVDAQLATGTPGPVESWLACDGVEEALTQFLPRRRGRSKEELTGTVHLHALDAPADVPSEWTAEFGPRGATEIRHAHEKADAAIRGSASDLLLTVWGRPATVERFGDETVAAAARAE